MAVQVRVNGLGEEVQCTLTSRDRFGNALLGGEDFDFGGKDGPQSITLDVNTSAESGAHVFLEAANTAYQPIHPQEELTIAAVVRAVIRKY